MRAFFASFPSPDVQTQPVCHNGKMGTKPKNFVFLAIVFFSFILIGGLKLYISFRKDKFELILGLLMVGSGFWGVAALQKWTPYVRQSLYGKLLLDFVLLFLGFVHYDHKIRSREHLLACFCPSAVPSNTCDPATYVSFTCGGDSQYFKDLLSAHLHLTFSSTDQYCLCKQEAGRKTIFTLVEKAFALLSPRDEAFFYLSIATAAFSVVVTFAALAHLVLEERGKEVAPAEVSLTAPFPFPEATRAQGSVTKRMLLSKRMVV